MENFYQFFPIGEIQFKQLYRDGNVKTSKYNDEVLFSNNYIVEVDSLDIENLKEITQKVLS